MIFARVNGFIGSNESYPLNLGMDRGSYKFQLRRVRKCNGLLIFFTNWVSNLDKIGPYPID